MTRPASADGSPLPLRRAALRGFARAARLLALATCACAAPEPPPNLVIVTLDTTRADHLGLYGYFRDTSPALDAFAEQALVFERCIVPMATTLPTHASLFTSTQPLEHGVTYNTTFGARPFEPSPRLRPLAEIARAAGYATAGFVSSAVLKRGTGIEIGFQHFDEPAGIERGARATTNAALAWLAQKPSTPFLLWVHYFDAHYPYDPPRAYRSRFTSDAALEAALAARRVPPRAFRPLANANEDTRDSTNRYDAELRHQDDQLARLLSALRARRDWRRTAVLIAGDHGEGLGQHGEAAHGGTWHEQLRAPLVMRLPGAAPRRVDTPITAVDVLPTWLGRLAVPGFEPLFAQASGRDVLAPDAAPAPVPSLATGRDTGARERRTALTGERWKLIEIEAQDGATRHLLFDLEADPFELADVAAAHPDVVAELAGALRAALEAQRRRGAELRGPDAPAPRAPDPALAEQLRALGYGDVEERRP
jgi:arylsulfatase